MIKEKADDKNNAYRYFTLERQLERLLGNRIGFEVESNGRRDILDRFTNALRNENDKESHKTIDSKEDCTEEI